MISNRLGYPLDGPEKAGVACGECNSIAGLLAALAIYPAT
jgi:hypothetical protein